ncbi:MAG: cardiolipin synthase [Clostridia bacterium]|nr:cardiolipin synthase [Clostridia bacterium]
MKKLIKLVTGRFVWISLAILLQLAWTFTILYFLSSHYAPVSAFLTLCSLLMLIPILERPATPEVKMAWAIPILLFPVFGGILYLMSGASRPRRKMRRSLAEHKEQGKAYLPDGEDAIADIRARCAADAGQFVYLQKQGYPCFHGQSTHFYKSGEQAFPDMLAALESAEKYIFIEYFIINHGRMWSEMLAILERKAAAGVEVKIIYDDVGSMRGLPHAYDKELEKKGIGCIRFNPYRPVYSMIMNNRDHRKFLIVDGKVGFTGGINIADEYINKEERFGYWKDNAVRIEGDAVRGMMLSFLQMWNSCCAKEKQADPGAYLTPMSGKSCGQGYVIPYADAPVDAEYLAENVYLNIISNATEYLYIATPYLIIDSQMLSALSLAAKRGVDVRIILPEIPDKKVVNQVTKSHYAVLLESGIKIYQYTPGFIHEKCVLCDDKIATVGTVNLDYRSLYLHYENGCVFYGGDIIGEIRSNMEENFATSRRIVSVNKKQRWLISRIYYAIIRLLAPVM